MPRQLPSGLVAGDCGSSGLHTGAAGGSGTSPGGGLAVVATGTFSAGSTTTSHNITLPAGIEAGYTIIYVISSSNDTSAHVAYTWTNATEITSPSINNGWGGAVAYQVAAGGESSESVTLNLSRRLAVCILVVNATLTLDAVANAGNTINPPNVNAAGGEAQYVLVAGAMVRGDSGAVTAAPAGYDTDTGEVTSGPAHYQGCRCRAAARIATVSSENPDVFGGTTSGVKRHATTVILAAA